MNANDCLCHIIAGEFGCGSPDITGIVIEKGMKVSLRENGSIQIGTPDICARCGQSLDAYIKEI